MSKPTAEQALEWLAIQTDRLNEIRNASTRDAGFREWRQNTLTILQRIWPGQAARFQRFRRVPFAPPSSRATEQEARACYERGIAETRKLLKIWEVELRNVGTAGFESQPSADSSPVAPIGHMESAPDVPTIDLSERPKPATPATPAKTKGRSKQRLGDMLGFGDWPNEVRSDAEAAPTLEPRSNRRAPAKPPRPVTRPANPAPATGQPVRSVARPANPAPQATASQPKPVARPANTASLAPSAHPRPGARPANTTRPLPSVPPANAAPTARPHRGSATVSMSQLKAAQSPTSEKSGPPTVPSIPAPTATQNAPAPPAAQNAPAPPVAQNAPGPTARSSDVLGRSIANAIEHARIPEPASGGLEIQPGFEGAIAPEQPSISSIDVRLSTSLGSSPSEVPPPGREFTALIAELERLGVPGGDLTRVGLGLAEMGARLDSGSIPWESMRETMALVMPFPGLARRVVPMLLRHFDAAA